MSPGGELEALRAERLADEPRHELDDLVGERDHAVVVGRDDDDASGVGEPAHDAEHAVSTWM